MAEMSLNRVELLGRLGADPEFRYSGSVQSQAYCAFNLATNQTWKDEGGVVNTKVDWHRVVAWSKIAETCRDYLRKGSKVYIEGTLHTRQYDENGQRKFITEVRLRHLIMLGSANNSNNIDADLKKHFDNAPLDGADDLPF